jgi:hypothetical protein
MKHINDNNPMTKINSFEDMISLYISIEMYYWEDEDGRIHLDTESIVEEFNRNVYGIESLLDDYNENLK